MSGATSVVPPFRKAEVAAHEAQVDPPGGRATDSEASLTSHSRVASPTRPPVAPSDDASTTASSSEMRTSRTGGSAPSSRWTAEMAAPATCSWPAAATSSAPAPPKRAFARDDAASCRTRPAMRATTSKNSTAEATMRTRTSVLPNRLGETDAGRDEARARRAARAAVGVRRVRDSVGGLRQRRASRDAARRRPRAGSRGSSRRRRSAGSCTSPSGARVVGGVGREQADDAADEQPERRRAPTGVDREADRGREQEHVAERIRDRRPLFCSQVDVRSGGCSARSGTPTRGGRCRS